MLGDVFEAAGLQSTGLARGTRTYKTPQQSASSVNSDIALKPGDHDWRLRAACRGLATEDSTNPFFSPHVCDEHCPTPCNEGKAEPGRFERIRRAKAICASCPVREDCLEFALATNQPFGIWGGMSERQRADLKKQRR